MHNPSWLFDPCATLVVIKMNARLNSHSTWSQAVTRQQGRNQATLGPFGACCNQYVWDGARVKTWHLGWPPQELELAEAGWIGLFAEEETEDSYHRTAGTVYCFWWVLWCPGWLYWQVGSMDPGLGCEAQTRQSLSSAALNCIWKRDSSATSTGRGISIRERSATFALYQSCGVCNSWIGAQRGTVSDFYFQTLWFNDDRLCLHTDVASKQHPTIKEKTMFIQCWTCLSCTISQFRQLQSTYTPSQLHL